MKKGKERRSRVYFLESAQKSIDRRLEELGMSFSNYLRWLVEKDIGVKP